MCGIAGVIDYRDSLEEQVLQSMQDSLIPRGPDQEGKYISPPAALLHRRLSVVDLEHGKQPMLYERGEQRFALVYNGELYNTPELRRELEALGHHFHSYSDTEALLLAYAEWGAECLHRLNGIFAFAVWEEHNQRLFFARDRIGVKPFFYARRDSLFVFGSELKALLAHPGIEPEVGLEGIGELMLLGPGRTPGCGVFRNVYELERACCGYCDRDGLRTWRYWELEDREHRENFGDTVDRVRWLVEDAIKRQLVSDVPVCTLLSGGLDSSIISAVADKEFSQQGKPSTPSRCFTGTTTNTSRKANSSPTATTLTLPL